MPLYLVKIAVEILVLIFLLAVCVPYMYFLSCLEWEEAIAKELTS